MFPRLSRVLAAALLVSPLAITPRLLAQKTAANQLLQARSTYYTPTTAGLQSLHCEIGFDWKAFLTSASGKPVADDNTFLAYLKTVSMGVDDSLRGKASLVWRQSSPPPENLAPNIDQLHSGLAQMISGYFQSWNQFMNGSMVPAPDATTTVTSTPSGLHLHAESGSTTVDEDFDQNMLLKNVHVVLSGTDVVMQPTYTDTPDGRILSVLDSQYRQPATAPPTHMILNIDYQQVSGFKIPATLRAEVINAGTFVFHFDHCTVGKVPSE